MILVVMGVAASGKSEVAAEISRRTGWRMIEGDDLHPPANRAKMAAGTPLQDADRWPWLDAIGTELSAADGGLVVTCSALKRIYRDRLRGHCAAVRFLFLQGPEELLRQRMAARRDHFMPPALLPSQLATLEPPGPGEPGVIAMDISPSVAEIAGRFLAATG